MDDLFDFNHGGATHPGARAIVHPGAGLDEHLVLYHVVTETDQHITLDDGYTYDKRTGLVRGPLGRSSLQNRMVATEGSAMFVAWSDYAHPPPRPGQDGARDIGAAVLRAPRRSLRALLRRLGRS